MKRNKSFCNRINMQNVLLVEVQRVVSESQKNADVICDGLRILVFVGQKENVVRFFGWLFVAEFRWRKSYTAFEKCSKIFGTFEV